MKKRYWIPATVIVIGGALFAINANKAEPPVEVTVEKATRGDITSIVTASGRIYPEVEVRISSEVSGEIVELPVSDGQLVEKGDLLVRVNPDTLEAQVHQQEAALRATQANAAEAKARMLQSELDLKRMRSLREKGYATPEQVDESETQYEISKASHQATLSRIEQQEMALQEARDTLAKATTFSPISGTVTTLGAELGDRVVGTGQFEGTEIMRVANLDNIEARVEVSEADIVAVEIGDEATLEIEALPDRVFSGVVSEIANSAAGEEEDGNSQELITFLVKVKVTDPSPEIRPGMTATADIKTETVTNVVKVPLQAVTVRAKDEVARQLREQDGDTEDGEGQRPAPRAGDAGNNDSHRRDNNLERVVFLYRDGIAILQPVETGLADNRSIEIKSGVEPDQEIITGGYRVLTRELAHEMPVSVAKEEGPPQR